MITLSAKLWLLLTLLAFCFVGMGLLMGVKLMAWVTGSQLQLLPFRKGDVAYTVPEDDDGQPFVSEDFRFGRLCVELVHKGTPEDVIPLEDIGELVFVSEAAAQRKLWEEACGSESV